jgi:hypothetical protein
LYKINPLKKMGVYLAVIFFGGIVPSIQTHAEDNSPGRYGNLDVKAVV